MPLLGVKDRDKYLTTYLLRSYPKGDLLPLDKDEGERVRMEIYEKAIGSVLLVAGLAIIGYSLYTGMNIFVKGQNPPEIFKTVEVDRTADDSVNPADDQAKKAVENTAPSQLPKNLNEMNPDDLTKMVTNSLSPEIVKSMIPPEMFNYIPRLLNLSVFSIFLWVLILAGTKIASLGVALVKTNADLKF